MVALRMKILISYFEKLQYPFRLFSLITNTFRDYFWRWMKFSRDDCNIVASELYLHCGYYILFTQSERVYMFCEYEYVRVLTETIFNSFQMKRNKCLINYFTSILSYSRYSIFRSWYSEHGFSSYLLDFSFFSSSLCYR